MAGAADDLSAGRVVVSGGSLLVKTVTCAAGTGPVSSPVRTFRRAVFSRKCEVTLDTFVVGIFCAKGLERRFVSQRCRGFNMDRIGQVLVKIVVVF